MSLAVADLFHARWSATIHHEWTRHLTHARPELAARLPALAERMNAAVPDSVMTGCEHLIASVELPDPDDRHVVAAAIVGHADAIVTATVLQPPITRGPVLGKKSAAEPCGARLLNLSADRGE